MNFDFFDDAKPAYIAVNGEGFHLAGKRFRKLECFIKEIIPVRKLFKGKKIECYSNDAKRGKNGDLCVLCAKRADCGRRIRLTMLVNDGDDEQKAAQLEINSNSFETLRKMLEPVEADDLPSLLVALEVKKQDKYLQIQFNPVF